jgi:hypothetical protein
MPRRLSMRAPVANEFQRVLAAQFAGGNALTASKIAARRQHRLGQCWLFGSRDEF